MTGININSNVSKELTEFQSLVSQLKTFMDSSQTETEARNASELGKDSNYKSSGKEII